MKTLEVITHDLNESGAPIGLFHLVEKLRAKWKIHVISPSVGPLIDWYNDIGIPCQVVTGILGEETIARSALYGADALLANTLVTIRSVAAAADMGVRCVWGIHETSEWVEQLRNLQAAETQGTSYTSRVVERAFNGASAVFTDCEYSRGLYQPFRNQPIDISAPGIVIRDQLPPASRHDDFRILLLGSIQRRKGHDIALKAMKILDDPKYQLNFIGSYAEPTFYKELGEIKTGASRVSWVGRVNEVTKQRAIDECDLVIVPSRDDLINLVALEALEAGKPVVFADVGGLCELMHCGVRGYVFPVDDPQLLASAIRHCANASIAGRESMGWYNRELVKEKFTIDRWADDIDRLLQGPSNAVSIESASPIHVLPTSADGEGVGRENAVNQIAA